MEELKSLVPMDIFDAEHGATGGVAVISGLSDFVRGGTTQVIDSGSEVGRRNSIRTESIGYIFI